MLTAKPLHDAAVLLQLASTAATDCILRTGKYLQAELGTSGYLDFFIVRIKNCKKSIFSQDL